MGSFSDYLEQKLLDHVFGVTVFTAPATVYVALYSATPGDANASGTELTGNGYARVAVTNNTANWPNATGTSPTTKQNGTVITFPTATGDWLSAVAFAIYDAAVNGNEICWGALTEAKTVFNGDFADFPVGTISVTLD